MESPNMIEKLADMQHEIWSHWMRYLFSICAETISGAIVISPDKVKHWTRQINTPYLELSEKEKESDRDQARKIIAVLESLK